MGGPGILTHLQFCPLDQPPPPPESRWTLLESGLLHVEGRLQSAETVQADGGPQRAGAAGVEGPGWPGEPCWEC